MTKNKNRVSRITARIAAVLMAAGIFAGTGVTAGALSRDYVVRDQKRYPIPQTYTLHQVINSMGLDEGGNGVYLKEPQDLFISNAGNIYIADTGNNRIVRIDGKTGEVGLFTEGGKIALKAPEGIFVDEYEHMFVADTGNARVVHLSADGTYIEEFTKPDSEILEEGVTFNVSKITISPTGYIYVIRGENILTIDAYGNFRGYMGQAKIGFRLTDWFIRMFASDAQKLQLNKRAAPTYTNITTGHDGMIYASSRDTREGLLKILNSVGDNIYRKYSTTSKFRQWINGLFLPDAYKETFRYGETRNPSTGKTYTPIFNDIAVDESGMVYGLENVMGRIYIYDQDGNNLAAFGYKGSQQGEFSNPVSLGVDSRGYVYVLDRVLGNIQIFKPTEFIQNIYAAVTANYNGEYDKAKAIWENVLAINENYEIAYQGMGRTLFKEERYEESMQAYYNANDRAGYSKAYAEHRYQVFRQNFVVIVAVIAVIVVGLLLLIGLLKRTAKRILAKVTFSSERMTLWEGLKFSLNAVFHPIDMCEQIKYNRSAMNIWSPVVLLVLFVVIKIYSIFVVHYPLADLDMRDTNLLLEIVKLLLLPFTWMAASFAVTSIFSGESKIKDIFIATSYCMVPHMLVLIPMPLISNVLSLEEAFTYKGILLGSLVWVGILLIVTLKEINGYSFKRSVGATLGVVAAMVIIWAVLLLVYVLVGRMFEFFAGVWDEFKMMLY